MWGRVLVYVKLHDLADRHIQPVMDHAHVKVEPFVIAAKYGCFNAKLGTHFHFFQEEFVLFQQIDRAASNVIPQGSKLSCQS